MDERDLMVLSQLPGPLRDLLIDSINRKLGVPSVGPKGGFDDPPQIPTPVVPAQPWTFNVGGNEAVLNLPANHGANFQGYLNYNFNPFSGGMGFRGGGLRYRYEF